MIDGGRKDNSNRKLAMSLKDVPSPQQNWNENPGLLAPPTDFSLTFPLSAKCLPK